MGCQQDRLYRTRCLQVKPSKYTALEESFGIWTQCESTNTANGQVPEKTRHLKNKGCFLNAFSSTRAKLMAFTIPGTGLAHVV